MNITVLRKSFIDSLLAGPDRGRQTPLGVIAVISLSAADRFVKLT
jgi:hypothetical protein